MASVTDDLAAEDKLSDAVKPGDCFRFCYKATGEYIDDSSFITKIWLATEQIYLDAQQLCVCVAVDDSSLIWYQEGKMYKTHNNVVAKQFPNYACLGVGFWVKKVDDN